MKTIFALLVLAALAFGGAYMGSAYFSVQTLREAARTGDKEKLEQNVDFPAVRESLKSQLSTAMMKKLSSDPDTSDNPLVAIGAMIAPAIVDRAVDAYVTPDAIAAMINQGKAAPHEDSAAPPSAAAPADPDAPAAEPADNKDDTKITYAFASIDRFKATFVDPEKPDKPIVMTMERRGVFTWKLVRIDLPLDQGAAKG